MQRAQFGPWEIEYDREATQAAYARMETYGCTCRTCSIFRRAVPACLPEAVLLFFEQLGISPEKPTEVIGGQGIYHLVGKYISGEDIWQPVLDQSQDALDESAERARAVQWFSLTEDFDVGFTREINLHPEEISPEQALEMQLSFQLSRFADESCTE